MAKQTINIGASPNDGTGTPLRTSFDYTNQNFTELYTALGGGVGLPGATTQVIFNDGGTNLAGDAGLVYNKTTDALTVAGLVTAGSATITGALTVDTTTLVVNPAGYADRVGIGTATPLYTLDVNGNARIGTDGLGFGRLTVTKTTSAATLNLSLATATGYTELLFTNFNDNTGSSGYASYIRSNTNAAGNYSSDLVFGTSPAASGGPLERYKIASDGVATWSNVGGVAGTAMTLNSTGLGIGASASHRLTVSGTAATNTTGLGLIGTTTAYNRVLINNTSGGGQFGVEGSTAGTICNSSTAYSTIVGSYQNYPLHFITNNNVQATLDASGNLLVGVTSANANGGVLQLKSGITFPATQVASSDANTLDDYEEGTWTPTLQFSGLSVGVTYSTQTGIYTKVGRIVHFSGRIDLSSKGTSVGSAAIAMLPFAANTGAASVGFQSSIAPSGAQAMLTIDGTQLIVRYASTTTTAQSTNSDFSNSSIIIFAGTYAV